MARIKNGLLSGILGEMVAYQLNGEQFMRKKPKRKAERTEAELVNQFQMALVTGWVKPLLEFVRIGFRNYRPSFQGFNAAMSIVRKEALVKDGFNSWIDPAKAKVSHGQLEAGGNFQVELVPDRKLLFTWDPQTGVDGSPRDRVMLLAYYIPKKLQVHETFGNRRMVGNDSLVLPPAEPGKWHLYGAFIAEDLSRQSDSLYLGVVEV